MLSKIISQNTEMSKKIDELLLVQKSLEGRMSRIEETSVDNPVNMEFINVRKMFIMLFIYYI
jgi:hypothetical protein